METRSVLVGVLILGLGSWWVWDSVQFYTCRLNKAHLYLIEGSFPSYESFSYGSGPLGLGLICTGVSIALPLSPDTTLLILTYIGGPFFLTGFGLMIWHPHWLTPNWLRWIKEYNYDIRTLLGQEARQTPDWAQWIKTRSDLETWVADVRKKYHEPQPIESYSKALERAGIVSSSRPLWGMAILIVAIMAGLGQLFLDNAFIGFIIGGGVVLALYLLQSRK